MGGALVWEEPHMGRVLYARALLWEGGLQGGSWEEAKVGGKVKTEFTVAGNHPSVAKSKI